MAHIATHGTDSKMPPIDGSAKRISEHLVRLVQVLFGVVAGQSLVLYRDVVMSPFDHSRIAAALALLSIYVMIVWSWIDWNTTMELRPYDFRRQERTPTGRFIEHSERFRLYSDIAIVTLYAYTLFQVAPLVGHPTADIRYLLLGYPIVFVLYLASGVLRIVRHGGRASNIPPILWYLGVFVGVLLAYIALRQTDLSYFALNCGALAGTVIAMRTYRWHRRHYSDAHKA